MQNAGPLYGQAASLLRESNFDAVVQSGLASSTSSLRQFRKKDVDKSGGISTTTSDNSSHVARVAPHNHYPPRANEYFRHSSQFADYNYKEPNPVKYSEISEAPQPVQHVTQSVIQKHKEKDYLEMCNIPQQTHLNKPYPDLNRQQTYPTDLPTVHHQYLHKDHQPLSSFKPDFQYMPKDGQYNQYAHIPKYNISPRKYPENNFLAHLQRLPEVRSIISDHHLPEYHQPTPSVDHQNRMYPQNQRYYPPLQNSPYSGNFTHRNIPQHYNYQSCNYSRTVNPPTSRYPPIGRSISPRRDYTDNLSMSMNYPHVSQKISPAYHQTYTPEYAQHYQHRRQPFNPDYYQQAVRSHQYIPPHQISQEVSEPHVTPSNNIRQYLENWAEEEGGTEVAAPVDNSKFIFKDPIRTREENGNEFFLLNPSDITQYLESGMVTNENGHYVFKSNVAFDSSTGAIKIVDKNADHSVSINGPDAVVSFHIYDNSKNDCLINTRQIINQNQDLQTSNSNVNMLKILNNSSMPGVSVIATCPQVSSVNTSNQEFTNLSEFRNTQSSQSISQQNVCHKDLESLSQTSSGVTFQIAVESNNTSNIQSNRSNAIDQVREIDTNLNLTLAQQATTETQALNPIYHSPNNCKLSYNIKTSSELKEIDSSSQVESKDNCHSLQIAQNGNWNGNTSVIVPVSTLSSSSLNDTNQQMNKSLQCEVSLSTPTYDTTLHCESEQLEDSMNMQNKCMLSNFQKCDDSRSCSESVSTSESAILPLINNNANETLLSKDKIELGEISAANRLQNNNILLDQQKSPYDLSIHNTCHFNEDNLGTDKNDENNIDIDDICEKEIEKIDNGNIIRDDQIKDEDCSRGINIEELDVEKLEDLNVVDQSDVKIERNAMIESALSEITKGLSMPVILGDEFDVDSPSLDKSQIIQHKEEVPTKEEFDSELNLDISYTTELENQDTICTSAVESNNCCENTDNNELNHNDRLFDKELSNNQDQNEMISKGDLKKNTLAHPTFDDLSNDRVMTLSDTSWDSELIPGEKEDLISSSEVAEREPLYEDKKANDTDAVESSFGNADKTLSYEFSTEEIEIEKRDNARKKRIFSVDDIINNIGRANKPRRSSFPMSSNNFKQINCDDEDQYNSNAELLNAVDGEPCKKNSDYKTLEIPADKNFSNACNENKSSNIFQEWDMTEESCDKKPESFDEDTEEHIDSIAVSVQNDYDIKLNLEDSMTENEGSGLETVKHEATEESATEFFIKEVKSDSLAGEGNITLSFSGEVGISDSQSDFAAITQSLKMNETIIDENKEAVGKIAQCCDNDQEHKVVIDSQTCINIAELENSNNNVTHLSKTLENLTNVSTSGEELSYTDDAYYNAINEEAMRKKPIEHLEEGSKSPEKCNENLSPKMECEPTNGLQQNDKILKVSEDNNLRDTFLSTNENYSKLHQVMDDDYTSNLERMEPKDTDNFKNFTDKNALLHDFPSLSTCDVLVPETDCNELKERYSQTEDISETKEPIINDKNKQQGINVINSVSPERDNDMDIKKCTTGKSYMKMVSNFDEIIVPDTNRSVDIQFEHSKQDALELTMESQYEDTECSQKISNVTVVDNIESEKFQFCDNKGMFEDRGNSQLIDESLILQGVSDDQLQTNNENQVDVTQKESTANDESKTVELSATEKEIGSNSSDKTEALSTDMENESNINITKLASLDDLSLNNIEALIYRLKCIEQILSSDTKTKESMQIVQDIFFLSDILKKNDLTMFDSRDDSLGNAITSTNEIVKDNTVFEDHVNEPSVVDDEAVIFNTVSNFSDGCEEKGTILEQSGDNQVCNNTENLNLPVKENKDILTDIPDVCSDTCAYSNNSSPDVSYRSAIKIEENSVLLHIAGELIELNVNQVNGKKVVSVVPISNSVIVDLNDNYSQAYHNQNIEFKSVSPEPDKVKKITQIDQDFVLNSNSEMQILEDNQSLQVQVYDEKIDIEDILDQSEVIIGEEDISEELILEMDEENELKIDETDIAVDMVKPIFCTKAAKKSYDVTDVVFANKKRKSLKDLRTRKHKTSRQNGNIDSTDFKAELNYEETDLEAISTVKQRKCKNITLKKADSAIKKYKKRRTSSRKLIAEKIDHKHQLQLSEDHTTDKLQEKETDLVESSTDTIHKPLRKKKKKYLKSEIQLNDKSDKVRSDEKPMQKKTRRNSISSCMSIEKAESQHVSDISILKAEPESPTSNKFVPDKGKKISSNKISLRSNRTLSDSGLSLVSHEKSIIEENETKSNTSQEKIIEENCVKTPNASNKKHIIENSPKYLTKRKSHDSIQFEQNSSAELESLDAKLNKRKLSIQEYNDRKRKSKDFEPEVIEKVSRMLCLNKSLSEECDYKGLSHKSIYSSSQLTSKNLKDPRCFNGKRHEVQHEKPSDLSSADVSRKSETVEQKRNKKSSFAINDDMDDSKTEMKIFTQPNLRTYKPCNSYQKSKTNEAELYERIIRGPFKTKKVSFDDDVKVCESNLDENKNNTEVVAKDSSETPETMEESPSVDAATEDDNIDDDWRKFSTTGSHTLAKKLINFTKTLSSTRSITRDDEWEDSPPSNSAETETCSDDPPPKTETEASNVSSTSKKRCIIDVNDFDSKTVYTESNVPSSSSHVGQSSEDDSLQNYKDEVDHKLNTLHIKIPKVSKSSVSYEKFMFVSQVGDDKLMQRFLRKDKLAPEEIQRVTEIVSFKKKIQELQNKYCDSPKINLRHLSQDDVETYEVSRSYQTHQDDLKMHFRKISERERLRRKKKRFRNLYSTSPDTSESEFHESAGDYSVHPSSCHEAGVPKLIFKRKTELLQPFVKLERSITIESMAKRLKY